MYITAAVIRATTAITTTTMTTTCVVSEFADVVVPVTPSSVGSSEPTK